MLADTCICGAGEYLSGSDTGTPNSGTGASKRPSLFGDRDFRKFWVGQSIAVFGAQFSPLAIQAIAINTLVVSNFQLGILGFLNTIPFLALGLFVGVWLDRHSRRRTLLMADLGRSVILFSIPLSAFLYTVTLNLLYAVTLLTGILTVFFEIGYQSYVPSLVDRSQLIEANSKLETTRSLSQALGPSSAGAVIYFFSAPIAVLGDTIGYVASWFSLLLIRKPEPVREGPRKSTWHDIREGLKVVFGNDKLRAIAGTTATSNLFASAFGVVLVKYFLVDLQLTIIEVGAVFGIGSFGGVVGALVASRVNRKLGVGPAIIASSLLFGSLATLLYFATPANGFAIATTVWFFSIVGALIYNVTQVSYRQALVPSEIQGRMNATMRTVVWGVIPLGNLMGGFVAQALGVRETVGIMALLASAAPLWVIFSPVRSVRDFPSSVDQ